MLTISLWNRLLVSMTSFHRTTRFIRRSRRLRIIIVICFGWPGLYRSIGALNRVGARRAPLGYTRSWGFEDDWLPMRSRQFRATSSAVLSASMLLNSKSCASWLVWYALLLHVYIAPLRDFWIRMSAAFGIHA